MKLTNLPPPTYAPEDPDATYAAFMLAYDALPAEVRKWTDPSRYYSDAWCAFLRDVGKADDTQAKNLRWMAHEWRRRALAPTLTISEQWTNASAFEVQESKPMREVAIKAHTNRRSQPPDPAYAALPELWAAGLTYKEIAEKVGKRVECVRSTIRDKIQRGYLEAR